MAAVVPGHVWQALSVLNEYIAGHCEIQDDVHAYNAYLQAEVTRLRHQLGSNIDHQQGKKHLENCELVNRFTSNGEVDHSTTPHEEPSHGRTPLCVANVGETASDNQSGVIANAEDVDADSKETPPTYEEPLARNKSTRRHGSNSYQLSFSADCFPSPQPPHVQPPNHRKPLCAADLGETASDCQCDVMSKEEDVDSKDSDGFCVLPTQSTSKQLMRKKSTRSTLISEHDEVLPIWNVFDETSIVLMDAYTSHNSVSRVSVGKPFGGMNSTRAKRAALDRLSSRPQWSVDPDSKPRVAWDCVTLLILAYDCVMVPLQLFDLPDLPGYKVIAISSTLFWTLDMGASAVTGFYQNGLLEMESTKILSLYFRTWFPFDVFVVTLDWVTLLISMGDIFNSVKVLRLLRFVRLLKLLRLFKLESLFHKHCERSNVGVRFMLILRFSGYIFGVLMFTHLLACIWYAIGNDGSEGWINDVGAGDSNDIMYLYFSSLHWAFTCFHGSSDVHPTTTLERAFAVLIVCYALFAVIWLQSTMTQMMIQMHTLSKSRVDQTEDLLRFFRERHVTHGLTQCIRAQLKQQQSQQFTLEENVVLLSTLPKGLKMDLHAEVMVPFFVQHSFFANLRDEYPRAIRQICHEAVRDYITYHNECFFVNGDASNEMYMVDHGVLEYLHCKAFSKITISHGQFACEGALWMKWNNCGDLLGVSRSCLLYKVDADKFRYVFPAHIGAHAKACQYARMFLIQIQKTGRSDIMGSDWFSPADCASLLWL